MDKIINLGIPHVAEQIFDNFDTHELIKCLKVSETWKVLAENVLIKRWKGQGKMYDDIFGRTTLMIACKNGHKDVVQLLLDNSDSNIELNARTNWWGRTALMFACSNGHKDVVQLLLDNS